MMHSTSWMARLGIWGQVVYHPMQVRNGLAGPNLTKPQATERKKMDKSNMSEEFHDWLEQCPVTWSKKYGEATYTFWEEDEDECN